MIISRRLENFLFPRQRKPGNLLRECSSVASACLSLFACVCVRARVVGFLTMVRSISPTPSQVLRPFDANGGIDPQAYPRNFGTNALYVIVKEILGKCFQSSSMDHALSDWFVESVAKNNFEWFYVSKPHHKLPHADFRPLDSTIQGKICFETPCMRSVTLVL